MDILFDRCVSIDQAEHTTTSVVYKALPPARMWESEDAEDPRHAAVARHNAAVEAPALATLREAAAASRSSSSGWRKEPVTFAVAPGADGPGYYRKLLNGVEPVLPPQLAAAPAVNSLTLRLSWLPSYWPATAVIASSHESLLALCIGSCRDYNGGYCSRRNLPGCYLVLDTRAKSLAVVPPLPDDWTRVVDDNDHSRYPIGSAGVAVLRTDVVHDGGYLLAELYRHTDRYRQSYLSSNEATLFLWCSPGSGSGGGPRAGADQWVRKEVVLPLPHPGPDEDGYCFNFNPETVFAVSSTSLCWVDVRAGILVCNNIAAAAADDNDDELVFTFIPLPEGCAPASSGLTEYRSACCVDSDTIKLLCIVDDGEEVTVAFSTWTLRSPLSPDGWRWEKDEDASCASLCVADLLDDAIPADAGGSKHRLRRRIVRWPVVGRAQPGVAHVAVHDIEFKREEEEWAAAGCYEVSIDVPRRRVASVFRFPARSPSRGDMLIAL